MKFRDFLIISTTVMSMPLVRKRGSDDLFAWAGLLGAILFIVHGFVVLPTLPALIEDLKKEIQKDFLEL